MRFGLCTGPQNFELAESLGFDYIECAVTAVEAMSDADFNAFKAKVDRSPLKVERFNVLFPGAFRFVGPDSKTGEICAYLERAFPRVKALGGTVVVFGSGRSRAFPPDMAYSGGFRELLFITRLIGKIAAKFDLIVAIEPLNSEETNCVNSVREGAMLEGAANLPSVAL